MSRKIVDPRPPIPAAYRTEERVTIQEMARDFAMNEVLPLPNEPDADAGETSDMRAAMVKDLAAEMSERVTSESLQIHGGAGYTTDFAVERYWRAARLTKIFEGTSEIMQRLVADHFLPKSSLS